MSALHMCARTHADDTQSLVGIDRAAECGPAASRCREDSVRKVLVAPCKIPAALKTQAGRIVAGSSFRQRYRQAHRICPLSPPRGRAGTRPVPYQTISTRRHLAARLHHQSSNPRGSIALQEHNPKICPSPANDESIR